MEFANKEYFFLLLLLIPYLLWYLLYRKKSEPTMRISSFKSPTAFVTRAARREFEQTSSAKSGDLCAGVYFSGFIS